MHCKPPAHAVFPSQTLLRGTPSANTVAHHIITTTNERMPSAWSSSPPASNVHSPLPSRATVWKAARAMSERFEDLGLIPPILRAVHEAGYEKPTPIQQRAIAPLLAGRDLLGLAQTG